MKDIPQKRELPLDLELQLTGVNHYLADYLTMVIDATPRQEISDDITGMNRLLSAIDSLSKTPFDEVSFDKECIALLDEKTEKLSKIKLQQHENAMKRGSLIIKNAEADEEVTVKIKPEELSEYKDAQVKALIIDDSDRGDENYPLEKESDIIQSMIGTAFEKYGVQLEKALKLLPNEDDLVEDLMNGQIFIADSFAKLILQPNEITISPDNRELKNAKRAIRRLIESLDTFIENPERVLAEVYIEAIGEFLDDTLNDNIQDRIASANTTLYTQKDKSDTRDKYIPTSTEGVMSKRERRKMSRFILSVAADDEIDLREPEYERIDSLESVIIATPWINNESREITELSTSQGAVYIVDACSEKLADIRDMTLAKNKSVEHKINVKIETAAEKIATGNLPWSSTNTFKRLHLGSETPDEYSDSAIYYISDVSPNAPRIYFSMKKAGEIEIVAEGEKPRLNPDQWCMMLVAITDKDLQIAALKQLTGRSTKQLIADGAGSI